MIDCQPIVDKTYKKVLAMENSGNVASYIPELAKVDDTKFGVCLTTQTGEVFTAGDATVKFSIQSIAKVLSLSLVLSKIGDDLWKRMDFEPSGTAFNSLVQLESENGIPRNPLINAGAIVVCDIICELFDNPKEALLDYIREVSGIEDLRYSENIAHSEQQTGYRNFALANFIKSFNNIKNTCDQVTDLYFHLCSIEMTCEQLSYTFGFLANRGKQFNTGKTIVTPNQAKRINAIMQTCGFYDEAGEFAYKVGLPGKSGVGGGMVAILPGSYAIAVWSPKLNKQGNSYRGMKFLQYFTDETQDTVF
ncbi:glutaminase [Dokdonia donghaensis]|uniref:Glutaminase n=1 Tax=Dokdonia donghaensis DSW-1 TaxID=1300343 RepID=A0A0A2GW44_9FLAO|nr:glutaminase [Dokdonia donghaensis]ANH59116.1 Thermolabile glutaminase [Dokdonia donghaensis DSW-1]KGO06541.1 glutaminase [Dokdonia donghaensis DSW-1]